VSKRFWEILAVIEVVLFIVVIIGNIIFYFLAMSTADACFKSYSLTGDSLAECYFHLHFARRRIINILITIALFSPAIGYTANKARKEGGEEKK